jgi:hypothetical protein
MPEVVSHRHADKIYEARVLCKHSRNQASKFWFYGHIYCVCRNGVVFLCELTASTTCIFRVTWRWRQHGPLKCWYPTPTLYGLTKQNTSSWKTSLLLMPQDSHQAKLYRRLYVLNKAHLSFLTTDHVAPSVEVSPLLRILSLMLKTSFGSTYLGGSRSLTMKMLASGYSWALNDKQLMDAWGWLMYFVRRFLYILT